MTRHGHPTKIHEEHLKALRDTEKTMKKIRKATRKELSEKPEE